jgi:hypothetical protein
LSNLKKINAYAKISVLIEQKPDTKREALEHFPSWMNVSTKTIRESFIILTIQFMQKYENFLYRERYIPTKMPKPD